MPGARWTVTSVLAIQIGLRVVATDEVAAGRFVTDRQSITNSISG